MVSQRLLRQLSLVQRGGLEWRVLASLSTSTSQQPTVRTRSSAASVAAAAMHTLKSGTAMRDEERIGACHGLPGLRLAAAAVIMAPICHLFQG